MTINGYDSIENSAFQYNSTSPVGTLEVDITGTGTISGSVFAGRTLGNVTIRGGSLGFYEETYQGNVYAYPTFCDAYWGPDKTLTLEGVEVPGESFKWSNAPDHFVARDCSIGMDVSADASYMPFTVALEDCTVEAGAFHCYNGSDLQSVSITGGSVGSMAFSDSTFLKTLKLENVTSIDKFAFMNSGLEEVTLHGDGLTVGNAAFSYSENLRTVVVDGNISVEQRAFVGCPVETLEFRNCTKIDGAFGESVQDTTKVILPDTLESISKSAFTNCKNFTGTLDLTGVKSIGAHAFTGCTNLTEILVDDDAQLAYSDIYPQTIENWEERVRAILEGKFLLEAADTIEAIAADGWTSAKTGKENGTNYGDTQLTKEAKWADEEETIADVQIKAYYTAQKQMDFVFVLDCTNSMSVVGSPLEDQYAKFYDMQSKLQDVTTELLSSGDAYDCRVAFTGYGQKAGSQQFTSGTFFGKEQLAEATAFISGIPNYKSLTNISLGLDEALKLVQANKAEGRSTAVILISDGTPNKNGSFTGFEDGYYGYQEAQAIREEGAEIYGVLHAMSGGTVDERAQEVMNTICGDSGKCFVSYDTEGFGQAVNDAIVAVYGEYVLTDVVDPAFTLDPETIQASAGEVTVSQDENGNTVLTWKISGMPFTLHTLTFQETLKMVDGSYPYGLFDTNEGDAVLTESEDPVNAVPTPQLPREETEEIPDESTPSTPPSSGTEEIPDESTPSAPPTGEGASPLWMLAGTAFLTLLAGTAAVCRRKKSCQE